MSVLAVIAVVSALLAFAGAVGWLGERLERRFYVWRLRRTRQREREALRVGRRNGYFQDGAVQTPSILRRQAF